MNLKAAVIIFIGNLITFSQLNDGTGLTKYSSRTGFSHPENRTANFEISFGFLPENDVEPSLEFLSFLSIVPGIMNPQNKISFKI